MKLKISIVVILINCSLISCEKRVGIPTSLIDNHQKEFSIWLHSQKSVLSNEKLNIDKYTTATLDWSSAIYNETSKSIYLEIPYVNEKYVHYENFNLNTNNANKITSYSLVFRKNKKNGIIESRILIRDEIDEQIYGDSIKYILYFDDLAGNRKRSYLSTINSNKLIRLYNSETPRMQLNSTNANNECYTISVKQIGYICRGTNTEGNYDITCGYEIIGWTNLSICDTYKEIQISDYFDYDEFAIGGGPVDQIKPDCATFENKVRDVLNSEGGYTNDPNDPGGATNKGITWDVWITNSKSILGIDPSLENLQNLSENQAKEIYKKLYWDPIHAENIIDGDLRYLLFDFYVNAGSNAVKVLQKTITEVGGPPVSLDGIIGANTLNAINSINPFTLYNTFKANRQQYYNKLVSRNAKLSKFLNGWTNRTNRFLNKTAISNINVNC